MAEFTQVGGSNGGSYAKNFTCRLTVWEEQNDEVNRIHKIGYKLELISGNSGRFSDLSASYVVELNGDVPAKGSGRYTSQSYNTAQTICSGYINVPYNSDSNMNITCSASLDFQSHTYSPGDFGVHGLLSLENTAAKAPAILNIESITEIGLDSIKVNYTFSGDFEHLQYSLNNGPWIQTYGSPSTIIQGLSPNTQYSIRLRGLNADKTLIGNPSNTKTVKTLDIGRIINLNNFEHGNNVNINITNPSKKSLNLEIKIGNTQILTQTVKEGQNTISFNDVMLDKIYKLYGKNDFLEISFILKTNNKHTETKTCRILLKGNQKSIYVKTNNSWKRGKIYIKQNNQWKKAVIWIKNNGIWKRTI